MVDIGQSADGIFAHIQLMRDGQPTRIRDDEMGFDVGQGFEDFE